MTEESQKYNRFFGVPSPLAKDTFTSLRMTHGIWGPSETIRFSISPFPAILSVKVLLVLLLTTSSIMGSSYAEPHQVQGLTDTEAKYLMELENTVRAIKESYYKEGGEEISVETLVDAALEGLVNSLDKESTLVDRKPPSMEFIRGLEEEASIAEARLLGESIGYIKIDFFGRRTGVDFKKALDEIEGMSGLIIDLRDNPGGVLQSALDVLGSLVPGGKLLFTEAHRKGRKQHFSKSDTAQSLPAHLPIVVLINASTASSAEIVAATLGHYRSAVIVGQRSHAKGTIQEVIPLSAKKTLVLTTGEYILVNGSSLKDSGIVPDYIVEGKKEQIETAVSLLKSP